MKRNTMSSTDIEKKSLEAHVELCAARYANLEEKLNNLEDRMDKLEDYLLDIKNTLHGSQHDNYKTLITIGTAVVGALFAAAITLVLHIVTK